MSWKNYGDVNPIEHGGMFVKHDKEVSGRCYYVVRLFMFDDVEKWLMIDGWVDLDDDWIDWNGIKQTCDTPKDADDEYLATDVMYYYGGNVGDEIIIDTYGEVIERLHEMGIEVKI